MAEKAIAIARPVRVQRRGGRDRFALEVERRALAAGVGADVERADEHIVRIDEAKPLFRHFHRRGDLEDLLNVPAMDGPRSQGPPDLATVGQFDPWRKPEPARQKPRARQHDPSVAAEPLKQRHVVVADDDVVPFVADDATIDAVAQQRKTVKISIVARCNEGDWSCQRFAPDVSARGSPRFKTEPLGQTESPWRKIGAIPAGGRGVFLGAAL